MNTLFLKTCGYVTLNGKKDNEDISKLKILRWEDYPGLSGYLQQNHMSPYKTEARGQESKEDIGRSHASNFEDG